MRIFCLILAAFCGTVFAQKATTRIQDFQANANQGAQRIFIKGENAVGAGSGVMDVTKPHVETFTPEGKVDAIIDAAQCFFDQAKSHDVWSAKEISMHTADGKIAIKGVGFRFTVAQSQLNISNKVEATLRRQSVIQSGASTNQDTIRITANQLTYGGETVIFAGNVLVVDRQGEVRCQLLRAKYSGNTLQEIEAIDDVILTQGETEARGKRAVYSQASGILRLTENAKWRMGDREGESGLLILDRTNNTVRAEMNVRMTFPASLLATNAARASRTNATASTNRVTIAADTFDYAQTNSVTRGPVAVFNGNVHAVDPQADLNCELLTIFFSVSNRVVRAIADRSVRIGRPDTAVQGERAVFENEEITITGKPHWTHEKQSGTSELLVYNPSTREIRAREVLMQIPFTARTNLMAGTNMQARGNTNVLVVTATFFTNKNDTAVFADKVRAVEPNNQIDANVVTVEFKTNRVDRILANGDVILTQETSQATGQQAVYDAKTQVMRLLGNPKLITAESEILAREFVRTTQYFKPLPPFQITIRQKGTNGFRAPF